MVITSVCDDWCSAEMMRVLSRSERFAGLVTRCDDDTTRFGLPWMSP
jgi:hypothetical protein